MVKLQLESNRQPLQRRMNWLHVPLIFVFLLLGIRLWWLQILQGAEYTRLAERNRIRSIEVVAPRGPILDRNNIPLVDNRPSLNILLYREMMISQEDTAAFITGNLGVSAGDLEAQLYRNRRGAPYQPVIVKEDVGIEDVSIVEAHQMEHPEIQLSPVPRRLYRFDTLGSHVLGYVGEVSEKDLANNVFPGARTGELVGRSGVERTYNQVMTGQNGARKVMVDSLGRELGVVGAKDAVIGGDLRLTLDFDLQAQAEALLAGNVGAIIAMNPRNGEILAMAGAPSFNPNSFSSRISTAEWTSLISDPQHPMQNRAIQNAYPPGSIFKLVMAEAGLDEGLVDDATRVVCDGSAVFYDTVFHCWNAAGHGTVNLENAIAQSCNIFFYTLGQRMGIETIVKHARTLGFGARTGIDLPEERTGVLPGGSRWYGGETISVSIGQGAVTATPLQLVRAVGALATNGLLVTPHVLLEAEHTPGRQWRSQRVPINPESGRRIRAGMWASVNGGGTGHSASIPGIDICGKTGTVQVVSAQRRKQFRTDAAAVENHAWFAGFASRDNPEIVVVVFLEHGGGGGAAAAPMAREIFRVYFEKKGHPEIVSPLSAPALGAVR